MILHVYLFGIILSIFCWMGFPILFSLTRLGLLMWCLFGFINLFMKTEPAQTSRMLKKIWFCLGLVVCSLAGYPVDFQTFPTAIVIFGLILSWSWLFVYIYAIKVRRAKGIIIVILIGIVSSAYWFVTPSGLGHLSGNHFEKMKKRHSFATELKGTLNEYIANNNQRLPNSINELTSYLTDSNLKYLSDMEMPSYIKSKAAEQLLPKEQIDYEDINNIRQDIIFCYEKKINPEKRYFFYSWGDAEWINRPPGRYVFYARGWIIYLSEVKFQEKLESLSAEFGEENLKGQTPFSEKPLFPAD